MFISAYLSNIKNWNPKKRIVKVIIPYILWTIIYTILQGIKLQYIKNFELILINFIKYLLTGSSAAVMYYIFVYCELILLIPFIDKLSKSKYKYLGFLISPIEIIIMRLFPIIIGYSMNEYVTIIMSLSCIGWFSYYYLGYLLGNHIIYIDVKTKNIFLYWILSILLQFIEGYWQYSNGIENCGTQLKLSSILSGMLFILILYRFIENNKFDQKLKKYKYLKIIGDLSFGIYFLHPAVIGILNTIPYYTKIIIYPFNAIIVVLISAICVFIGRKVLGKYSKYLAL